MAEANLSEPVKRCPYCGETILEVASKCKHCGEYLTESLRVARTPVQKPQASPGIAAFLSLVIPGAGQMYKGEIFNGIAWLILVGSAYYVFLFAGILLHLFCICGATLPKRKGWISSFKEGLEGK